MRLLVVVILLWPTLTWSAPCFPIKAHPLPAWVVNVYDGDTLEVASSLGSKPTKIRIPCVDAPEMAGTRWLEQPGAKQARDFVFNLTVGRWVAIYGTSTSYNRLIRHMMMYDGRDLSEVLVKAGWAWVDPRFCRRQTYCLQQLQDEARKAKRGLWGLPGPKIPPWEWRKGRRQ